MTEAKEFLVGHIIDLIEDLPCTTPGVRPMPAGSRGILCEYEPERSLWIVAFDTDGSKRYVNASNMRIATVDTPRGPQPLVHVKVFPLTPEDRKERRSPRMVVTVWDEPQGNA